MLDVTTLLIASALVITLMAVLIIVDALSRPLDGVGRIWSLAFLSGSLSCFAFIGTIVNNLALGATVLGTATMVLALAAIWSGARLFSGRTSLIWVAFLVTAVSCVAVVLRWDVDGTWAGAEVLFASIVTFALLTAAETMRRPLRDYRNAKMLTFGTLVGGSFYLIRLVVYLTLGRDSAIFTRYFGTQITTIVVMLLVVVAGMSITALRGEEGRRGLYQGSVTDALTGASTSTGFRMAARPLVQASGEADRPISVVMVDIDRTQETNLALGRSYVDRSLQRFVTVLRERLPSDSVIGREGGDRFVFLLPDAGEEEGAHQAEDIRSVLEATPLVSSERAIRITGSFGVVGSPTAGYDIEAMLAMAAEAVGEAKQAGRNTVVVSRSSL